MLGLLAGGCSSRGDGSEEGRGITPEVERPATSSGSEQDEEAAVRDPLDGVELIVLVDNRIVKFSDGEFVDLVTPDADLRTEIGVAPNDGQLAFITEPLDRPLSEPAPETLWVTDGTEPTAVLTTSADGSIDIKSLGWNSTGELLAFDWSNGSPFEDVYIYDGDAQPKLVTSPHGGDFTNKDSEPFWGPDPEVVFFRSSRNRQGDVFRINVDGSGLQQLTPTIEGQTQYGNATVSPDGETLIAPNLVGTAGGIWIGSTSTTEGAWLVSPLPSEVHQARQQGSDLLFADPATGEAREASEFPVVVTSDFVRPVWSPDGSRTLYAARRLTDPTLDVDESSAYVIDTVTRTIETINTSCPISSFGWASDEILLFTCDGRSIRMMSLAGETPNSLLLDVLNDVGSDFSIAAVSRPG